MIKLKNNKLKLQYSELNLKQRLFEKESIVSLELKTSFYPSLIDEDIVFGSIDLTVDCNIKSLQQLVGKEFNEGKVVVNLNENGNWNSYTFYEFKAKFIELNDDITFELTFTDCEIKEKANITSLYSIGNKDVSEYFDLSSFHKNPIVKQIANKEIFKYYKK